MSKVSSQAVSAVVGIVVFAGASIGIYTIADTSDGEASEIVYEGQPLPTTTTTSTTTTTTTTTTLAPGVEPPPTTEAPDGPVRNPEDYPSEPPDPTDVVGTILYGLLVDQGVPGNQANCAIQVAYETAGPDELIAMGIADGNPEAIAIVNQAALDCGIPQEVIDAAIASQLG